MQVIVTHHHRPLQEKIKLRHEHLIFLFIRGRKNALQPARRVQSVIHSSQLYTPAMKNSIKWDVLSGFARSVVARYHCTVLHSGRGKYLLAMFGLGTYHHGQRRQRALWQSRRQEHVVRYLDSSWVTKDTHKSKLNNIALHSNNC